ncbi:MAG: DciA family protein [Paracoccaceae bacterium]|jgi:hypothetical protein|nr:DciA family protein [Paracoccaceae bacterium]
MASGTSADGKTARQGRTTRRGRGFRQAGALVETRVRTASESRGFAVSRLLTHWDEVAGRDIAAIARPVEVSYAKGGLGATLTLLTTGAHAPLLQMQEPRLRERINACYGYAAISRIRLTQTAPTGFAEGQAAYTGAPSPRAPDPVAEKAGESYAKGVADDGLRAALARLGANILSRSGRAAPATDERP